jgi:hypothetical protein
MIACIKVYLRDYRALMWLFASLTKHHWCHESAGTPSERTQTEKLQDLKKLAQHYARDWGSCDDVQLSYLETLEDRNDDNLRLAQMLAG